MTIIHKYFGLAENTMPSTLEFTHMIYIQRQCSASAEMYNNYKFMQTIAKLTTTSRKTTTTWKFMF